MAAGFRHLCSLTSLSWGPTQKCLVTAQALGVSGRGPRVEGVGMANAWLRAVSGPARPGLAVAMGDALWPGQGPWSPSLRGRWMGTRSASGPGPGPSQGPSGGGRRAARAGRWRAGRGLPGQMADCQDRWWAGQGAGACPICSSPPAGLSSSTRGPGVASAQACSGPAGSPPPPWAQGWVSPVGLTWGLATAAGPRDTHSCFPGAVP